MKVMKVFEWIKMPQDLQDRTHRMWDHWFHNESFCYWELGYADEPVFNDVDTWLLEQCSELGPDEQVIIVISW